MLCDNCKKNNASVHITQINNTNKVDLYLCEECAAKYDEFIMQKRLEKQQNPFSTDDFISGVFQKSAYDSKSEIQSPADKECTCPVCGLTYTKFTHTGKLGCSNCYITFKKKLGPLLRHLHGVSRHTGKFPSRAGKTMNMQQELTLLRKQIKTYVANEEYEKAAQVRDCIRDLEKKMHLE